MSPSPLTRADARKLLEESMRALLAEVGGLGDQEARAIPVSPEWSVADSLSHVLAWAEVATRALGDWTGDRSWLPHAALEDHDAFNAAAVEARRASPFSVLLEGLMANQQILLAVLAQASDEQLAEEGEAPWGGAMPLLRMIAGIGHHNADHARELAAIMAARRS
ncbi:MAG TPA: DinB family protein [Herpetosiphonaceae bacterium]